MWLLEQEEVFEGRRLWLRPGKLYLFGRTASEPGSLAIAHKTISRKHMTIQVHDVPEGSGQDISKRSRVTITDLATKTGTKVNGVKLKNESHDIIENTNIQLGGCTDIFELSWHPIVLTFSFSNRELQSNPLAWLSDTLEQLDIKFSVNFSPESTTHLVTKKRNTPKSLQALVNGKYIVAESFVDAISAAATSNGGEEDVCPLESDFDKNWPNPLQHLPPRGGEPGERQASDYAPQNGNTNPRQNVFEGYTFVFYDDGQFDNLLAPITDGKGKAIHTEVIPEKTSVDDFILRVKTEAGEKGLGSFDDGSEGRGIVVVRFTPNKGPHVAWYADFFNQVSVRLDHRPIEQNEFLEAILGMDASILRRPLELATTQDTPARPPVATSAALAPSYSSAMDVDQPEVATGVSQDSSAPIEPPARRDRVRRAATRRFAGFDDNSDDDRAEEQQPTTTQEMSASAPIESQEELFVSQEPQDPALLQDVAPSKATRSQRNKRPAAQQDDLMEGFLPTATAAKRRRIEAGGDPVLRRHSSESPQENEKPDSKSPLKKVKKEIDVLEEARKRREELEAQAKAEKEDLANLPSDIDLDDIRRLHIVEEMEIRRPMAGGSERSREQDIANGRWDPRWNGRKNFKRFQQRGATGGRAPMKVIVKLDEVKKKDFGIGDDYWLEDGGGRSSSHSKKMDSDSVMNTHVPETHESRLPSQPRSSVPRSTAASSRPNQRIVLSDDEDEDEGENGGNSNADVIKGTPSMQVEEEPQQSSRATGRGTRSSARTTTQTQSQDTSVVASSNTRSQAQRGQTSQAKRSAAAAPGREPPAKKARPTRQAIEVQDSDEDSDDDDELKFKFGRRR